MRTPNQLWQVVTLFRLQWAWLVPFLCLSAAYGTHGLPQESQLPLSLPLSTSLMHRIQFWYLLPALIGFPLELQGRSPWPHNPGNCCACRQPQLYDISICAHLETSSSWPTCTMDAAFPECLCGWAWENTHLGGCLNCVPSRLNLLKYSLLKECVSNDCIFIPWILRWRAGPS